ncbi:hypothetical protein MyNCGM121_02480 [Achromobacter xylosoxidans]
MRPRPAQVKIGELLEARFRYNPSLSPGRASSKPCAPLLPNGPCRAVPGPRRVTGQSVRSAARLQCRAAPPIQTREYVNRQRRQQDSLAAQLQLLTTN